MELSMDFSLSQIHPRALAALVGAPHTGGLPDLTKDGRGWPTSVGPIQIPVTLVVLGRETRTVWYRRLAPEVEAWIWYGPGLAYQPAYADQDHQTGVPSTWG